MIEQGKGKRRITSLKSFGKIYSLLLYTMSNGRGVKIEDIMRELKLNFSITKRWMSTLQQFNFVEASGRGKKTVYVPGSEIFKLYHLVREHHPILSSAYKYMVELRDNTGVPCGVGTIVNGKVKYLEIIPVSSFLDILPAPLKDYEILNTALGLSIISSFSRFHFMESVKKILEDENLKNILLPVKQKGYARLKTETGILEISTPLREKSGDIWGALSVFLKDGEKEENKIVELLLESARKISENAGYDKSMKENS